MIPVSAIIVLVLGVVLSALYQPLDSNSAFVTQKPKQREVIAKNILLVTAHPDDEAMFFAPTILNLVDKASNGNIGFSVVCLSNGNAEGLGKTRTSELERSFDILRVPATSRRILDHPQLQDNMTADWDRTVIAKVLEPYVLDLDIDTILTFDEQGVSSHPNHKSIHRGVQTLIQNLGETSSKQPRRLFTLVSSSLAYKYTSIFSVVFSKVDVYGYRWMQLLEHRIIRVLGIWYPDILTPAVPWHPDGQAMPEFVSGFDGYLKALEAMQAHESQLVWFRWLYVVFSKYMWVNSWVQVSADAQ